ncbi:SRPBCC family protein [Prescottella agglutinans]|uniref:SRPBCC family protein n=1 Tax=Prescottella agglutinans TaxID=1644129 RepID=UPI003D98FF23
MRFAAHRETAASPERVWDVLCDGWKYPSWVVGASRMRAVDPNWPAPGSRIHHSVGLWPFLLDDHTEVAESVPGRSLTLVARAKMFGRARIELHVHPDGEGSVIDMGENLAARPASWFPQPLIELAALPRNRECVRRLALLAEGPAAPGPTGKGSGTR